MRVKCFDEQHEDDLTKSINIFLAQNEIEVIDIKFSTSAFTYEFEQIFCFSALLIYQE